MERFGINFWRAMDWSCCPFATTMTRFIETRLLLMGTCEQLFDNYSGRQKNNPRGWGGMYPKSSKNVAQICKTVNFVFFLYNQNITTYDILKFYRFLALHSKAKMRFQCKCELCLCCNIFSTNSICKFDYDYFNAHCNIKKMSG